jgi:hypothetical protein
LDGDASKEEQGTEMPVTVVSGPTQHDLALVLTSEVAAPSCIEAVCDNSYREHRPLLQSAAQLR